MDRAASIAIRVAEWRIQEDVYPRTPVDEAVIEALGHWHVQRDYDGSRWGGIEYFNFCLAKVADVAAVEFPVGSAWFTYDSSTREKPDGKDWRFVVLSPAPDSGPVTVVNCHSMVHDGSWTLTKTVYSSNEIDMSRLTGIGHPDPWMRSMLWSLAVVRGLREQGYDYAEVERDMIRRIEMGRLIHSLLPDMIDKVESTCVELFGNRGDIPEMTVVVAKWRLPEGKIGSFKRPGEDNPWGIMTISPNAFEKNMVEVVLMHELCHAAIKKKEGEESHNERFLALADAMKIPKEWQD